jgi:hypothetical protein
MAVRLSALRAGRPLLPGISLVLISVRGWVGPMAIMWLEGLYQLKNPMTSSELEPATFRLVSQCVNQLRYCVLRLGRCREQKIYTSIGSRIATRRSSIHQSVATSTALSPIPVFIIYLYSFRIWVVGSPHFVAARTPAHVFEAPTWSTYIPWDEFVSPGSAQQTP